MTKSGILLSASGAGAAVVLALTITPGVGSVAPVMSLSPQTGTTASATTRPVLTSAAPPHSLAAVSASAQGPTPAEANRESDSEKSPAKPKRDRAARPAAVPAPVVTSPGRPTRATPGTAATAGPRVRTAPPPANSGPTAWAALNAAISRIPGYDPSGIGWTVTSRYGHLGATDLATGQIYISPSVSTSQLDSVVRHEYAHVVTVRAYGGDWRTARSAMNAAFGGSGRTGAERAADCMAKALGASWTHYTSCSRGDWRAYARQLLAGRRL